MYAERLNLENLERIRKNIYANEYVENVFSVSTSLDEKIALLGFDNASRISKIFDKSRLHEISFAQGYHAVIFNHPIEFSNNKCLITKQSKHGHPIHYCSTETTYSKMFIRNNG